MVINYWDMWFLCEFCYEIITTAKWKRNIFSEMLSVCTSYTSNKYRINFFPVTPQCSGQEQNFLIKHIILFLSFFFVCSIAHSLFMQWSQNSILQMLRIHLKIWIITRYCRRSADVFWSLCICGSEMQQQHKTSVK
jgi:hypothetical protein